MHRPPLVVRLIVLVVIATLVGVGAWYYLSQQTEADEPLAASGTIEANEVSLGPVVPGRVLEVLADESDAVTAGQPVLILDGAVLQAQRDQGEAAVAAADANVQAAEQNGAAADASAAALEASAAAAEANVRLLETGPSAEQLAVAQATVDRAQVAVDDLEEAYDDLSGAEQESPPGVELKIRRDLARADLETALANQRLVAAGAQPEQIDAAREQADAARAQAEAARLQAEATAGQVDAARAQADAARAALAAVDRQIEQLTVASPIDGVVLTRAINPGEYAAPGATLLVVGQLDPLNITVYVPEDRYGVLNLGQVAQVSVDSFPGEAFSGTVVHIADQAEFTPRNVQTAEGRRSTVFAIRLEIANQDRRLKPGMPADVRF